MGKEFLKELGIENKFVKIPSFGESTDKAIMLSDLLEIYKDQLIIQLVSQQREQLIALLKHYENKPLTIGLEEPEFLVDKFLAINCG